uniref:Uncharacterized protein n=1 Tax=Norrisiella sphaerica TaxID=552664 RepID=A0A7S2VVS2_9EUKA
MDFRKEIRDFLAHQASEAEAGGAIAADGEKERGNDGGGGGPGVEDGPGGGSEIQNDKLSAYYEKWEHFAKFNVSDEEGEAEERERRQDEEDEAMLREGIPPLTAEEKRNVYDPRRDEEETRKINVVDGDDPAAMAAAGIKPQFEEKTPADLRKLLTDSKVLEAFDGRPRPPRYAYDEILEVQENERRANIIRKMRKEKRERAKAREMMRTGLARGRERQHEGRDMSSRQESVPAAADSYPPNPKVVRKTGAKTEKERVWKDVYERFDQIDLSDSPPDISFDPIRPPPQDHQRPKAPLKGRSSETPGADMKATTPVVPESKQTETAMEEAEDSEDRYVDLVGKLTDMQYKLEARRDAEARRNPKVILES